MIKLTIERDLTFEKYAWEAKVLYQEASEEQRTSFLVSILETAEALIDQEALSGTDLNDVSGIRVAQYLNAMDAVINVPFHITSLILVLIRSFPS